MSKGERSAWLAIIAPDNMKSLEVAGFPWLPLLSTAGPAHEMKAHDLVILYRSRGGLKKAQSKFGIIGFFELLEKPKPCPAIDLAWLTCAIKAHWKPILVEPKYPLSLKAFATRLALFRGYNSYGRALQKRLGILKVPMADYRLLERSFRPHIEKERVRDDLRRKRMEESARRKASKARRPRIAAHPRADAFIRLISTLSGADGESQR